MAKQQFGVSTHLYRAQRLRREHVLAIAAHGFEGVEVDAASGQFDAGNSAAVADLQQWLAEAALELSAIAGGEAALLIARRIPVKVLIVPFGSPRETARLVEPLAEAAAPLGVTIALDSRPSAGKPAVPIGSVVHFVERADVRLGIALDCASAAKGGGLIDAIEAASEHLVYARVPAESAIDWSNAMTTLQKVGYEGPFIVDAAPGASMARTEKDALARARKAREEMERWLTST